MIKSLGHINTPKSVWTFPIILTLIFSLLVIFSINGSSVGVYHEFLYGDTKTDPDLIFGKPRHIRSDEWLVNTNLTIAQKASNYPRINTNLIGGKADMSLIVDVPYKEWSTIFKPQNLSFFILPFENAFALKWWSLLYLLILSSYFFILRILPKQTTIAILLSIAFGLSPFFFWWYQSITIVPVFLCLFTLTLFIRVGNKEKVRIPYFKITLNNYLSFFIYSIVFVYLFTCFALVQYPSFQIPLAILILVYCLGYALNMYFDKKNKSIRSLFKTYLPVFIGIVGATIVVLSFILTRTEALKSVLNTVYPGSRDVKSGGLNALHIFDGFLSPQLQFDSKASHFFTNQSEASSFIIMPVFLLIPSIVVIIYLYKKKKYIDWTFVGINSIVLFFLIRMFLPIGNGFFKLFGLNEVLNKRLVYALGVIGLVQLALFISNYSRVDIPAKKRLLVSILYGLVIFLFILYIGYEVKQLYPLFISSHLKIILSSLVAGISYGLIVNKNTKLALVVILCFSIASIIFVHPIYRGVGDLGYSVTDKIRSTSENSSTWGTFEDIRFENFALISNQKSLSGVQVQPNNSYWEKVLGGAEYESVYNRYSHVVFDELYGDESKMKVVVPDFIKVKFSCDMQITQSVDFILSTSMQSKACLELIDTLRYPNINFFIYKTLK